MVMKITHPLEAKVDQIIEDELGTELVEGVQISLASFEHIRNKEYVRRRLEQRGFKLMSGHAARYSYKLPDNKNELVEESVKPRKYLKQDVMNRFVECGQVTTAGLNLRERKRLITTISYLRRTGMLIKSERVWLPKVGFYEITYKIKNL